MKVLLILSLIICGYSVKLTTFESSLGEISDTKDLLKILKLDEMAKAEDTREEDLLKHRSKFFI
jgi:hypothetical protein